MKYNKKIAVSAFKTMIENHDLLPLQPETIDAIANAYYRMFYFLVLPNEVISNNPSIDYKLRARFLSESLNLKEIVDNLLKVGEKFRNDQNNDLFLKIQEDVVDVLKYGIENPQDKWGWTRSRERKSATVVDIPWIIARMSEDIENESER